MVNKTLEELEEEMEQNRAELIEMYESGKYTKEELVKKSQEVDPLIIEVMRMKMRIDKMIKDYSLRLVEGKIVSDGWLVSESRGDFRFFKKNKSAFLNRLIEIELKNKVGLVNWTFAIANVREYEVREEVSK